ncbi:MAG: Crp/Fnr family transcriptional regulator [Bacteroidota bacterium]
MKKILNLIREYIPELPPALIHDLEHNFKLQAFEKGATIIKEGAACRHLYFLEEGLVRYHRSIDGKELTTWFSFPNEFMTVFDSFFLQIPSKETVESIADCRLYAISYPKLQQLFENSPIWERIGRIFITLYAIQLEDRIYMLQGMTAEEKYAYLLQKQAHIVQTIPGKYISSYLGITRETLSRIRSK